MLSERYDLSGESLVVRKDFQILGDRIDSRKAYFTKLHRMHLDGKVRNLRNGLYRRGNIFANRGFSQRVVVKAHYKKHGAGGAGVGNLRGHLSYITRDGAGMDEKRPGLFGSAEESLDRVEFYHACKNDRHHFRLIISPENGHEIDDFEGYITRVMGRVEEDLDTRLSWVSAIHYDTDNHHAHVVLRGKDDQGKDLVIAPDYISFGIRGVAQEIVTEILGERSIEDINKSMEKETGALRVTSLDRFIADRGQEVAAKDGGTREIRVKSRELGRKRVGAFYNSLVQRRLAFLASTSMARAEAHGVYYVRSDFMEELKEISEKNDVIKQLHRSLPKEALDEGVSIYKIVDGEAPVIQGRIEKIANVNELTDHKYMALRDGLEKLHYVPLSVSDRSDALEEGMIVEVSAGEKSTGHAKRYYRKVKSLSRKSITEQIDVRARTWLDLEIYRYQKGYDLSYPDADKETLEAIHKRQDWLLENGYGDIQEETGLFVMSGSALGELYKDEVDSFSEKAARRLGVSGVTTIQLEHGQSLDVNFVGYVELHSGNHVVVEKNDYISVVKTSQNYAAWSRNETVSLEMGKWGVEIHRKILDKSKDAIDIDF